MWILWSWKWSASFPERLHMGPRAILNLTRRRRNGL